MSEKKDPLIKNWISFLFGKPKSKKEKLSKEQKELQGHYKHVQPKHVEKKKGLFI